MQHFGRRRRVDHEVKRSRPSWSTWWNPVSTKNTKISWAWWWAPVIPATQKAEAGELLEPGRWRLQRGMIAPLHSSLGSRARGHLKKKKKKLHKSLPYLPPSYSKSLRNFYNFYQLLPNQFISNFLKHYIFLVCSNFLKANTLQLTQLCPKMPSKLVYLFQKPSQLQKNLFPRPVLKTLKMIFPNIL